MQLHSARINCVQLHLAHDGNHCIVNSLSLSHTHTHTHTHTQSNYGNNNFTQQKHTSASARTQSHRLSCLNKEMGFQRRSERLNGVLLLDALGYDIPGGSSSSSSSSKWILMSCQPHRVTTGQSNSGHMQICIYKLFSHNYQPSVKSIYKTNHFANIKLAYKNIRHKFRRVTPFNITPVKRAHNI